MDNVIDVHVARLRRKVDEQFEQKLLHTVRGVGFVMREETGMGQAALASSATGTLTWMESSLPRGRG